MEDRSNLGLKRRFLCRCAAWIVGRYMQVCLGCGEETLRLDWLNELRMRIVLIDIKLGILLSFIALQEDLQPRNSMFVRVPVLGKLRKSVMDW